MSTLSQEEIDHRLSERDDWTQDGDSLTREFKFADFVAAMDFMASATPKIDAMNHHPEWTNVYDTVSVSLTSHDAGGITEKDFVLATILDEIANAR